MLLLPPKIGLPKKGRAPRRPHKLRPPKARSHRRMGNGLLGLGRLRVWWVKCCIREHVEVARCFRFHGYGYVSRSCTLPGRKDACWRCGCASHVATECKASSRCLTCADRGENDVTHSPGSCFRPIFRAELQRLRSGK